MSDYKKISNLMPQEDLERMPQDLERMPQDHECMPEGFPSQNEFDMPPHGGPGMPSHHGGPGMPPHHGGLGMPPHHGGPGMPPHGGPGMPPHGGPGMQPHHGGPGMPPHGGPGMPPHGGPGMPPHHGGPGMPPHHGGSGMPPHGEHRMPPRPELWEDQDELGSLLRRCGHRLIHQEGNGKRQEQVLKLLYEYETLSQRELLDIMKIQPGSLSELLAKLEAKSLIERRRKDEDRRILMLTLTSEGLSLAEAISEKGVSQVYAALTEEEQETLKTLLKKLLDSWNSDERREPEPKFPKNQCPGGFINC